MPRTATSKIVEERRRRSARGAVRVLSTVLHVAPSGRDVIDKVSPEVSAALRSADEALVARPDKWRDLAEARRWFDVAIDVGGDRVRWHLADRCFTDYPEGGPEHARWCLTLWAQAILADHDASGLAGHLWPGVLGPILSPRGDLLTQAWGLTLRTPRTDRAVVVLAEVGRRCMYVARDGRELSEAALEANVDCGYKQALYTPNWVSDPQTDGAGDVTIKLDCQDLTSAPMARTMLSILREELQRHDLQDADIVEGHYHRPKLDLRWDDQNRRFELP